MGVNRLAGPVHDHIICIVDICIPGFAVCGQQQGVAQTTPQATHGAERQQELKHLAKLKKNRSAICHVHIPRDRRSTLVDKINPMVS